MLGAQVCLAGRILVNAEDNLSAGLTLLEGDTAIEKL